MTIEPPQPPTAPAPAIRPSPPTPPRIDRTPFTKDTNSDTTGDNPQVQRKVDNPESMARDAVANGSGPLTKRTVTRDDDNRQSSPPANQTVTVIPPDAPLISDGQSDYDRGKDVLREFSELDRQSTNQSDTNSATHSTTEQPRNITAHLNQQEGHGAIYWLLTLIIVSAAAFIIVKKFLLTDKPALTASQLFEDSSDRLKAASDKIKPARQPSTKKFSTDVETHTTSPKTKAAADVKPVTPPQPANRPKKDDDKGKHFEIRV